MRRIEIITIVALILLFLLAGCASTDQTKDIIPVESSLTEPERTDAAVTDNVTTSNELSQEVPDEKEIVTAVEIIFDFERMSTMASNQFAIWIEDEGGDLVKTIFVTDFTGARRGYRNRDTSLSHWVAKVNPEELSDTAIDAISGATPQAGKQSFVWDMTDANGVGVSDGIYRIMIEGTLYWESNVLCTAVLNTEEVTAGNLPVTIVRSEPDNTQNEDMLTNITITVLAEVK